MHNFINKVVLIFGGTGVLMGNLAINLSLCKAKVIIVGRSLKDNRIDIGKDKKFNFNDLYENITSDTTFIYEIQKLFSHSYL